MNTPTLYDLIGDEKLQQLVQNFYDRVLQDPTIAHLFTTDIEMVKKKQYFFLSQFLGGPQRYNAVFGNPRMRMRHLPHKITNEAKEAWLACMQGAIQELDIEDRLKQALYECFPKLAQHMVNS